MPLADLTVRGEGDQLFCHAVNAVDSVAHRERYEARAWTSHARLVLRGQLKAPGAR
jgi:hypothetical protein